MAPQAIQSKGLSILGIIILIALGIVILGYFNISIKSVVEKPVVQENTSYVTGVIGTLWNRYLATPALYIWNNIFLDLFWGSFIENMHRIKDGQPTWFEQNAPQVN